ncbi:MAG: hypothetical protein H6973_08775 [Gammaproteobacteria bacterium]|nr:hypothetical protein [Gammaproteobacteria bacterium]HRX72220.1 hypothetical protein [Candidatus Competibacteraceae bacterium]
MKWIGKAGAIMFIMVLTPGCAYYQSWIARFTRPASAHQPQTAPAVPPSALEPKLDAMDNRLDRIEQMLADVREQGRQRQIQEERSQQSLAGLRQETRNTHLAVASLRKLLAKQHSTLVTRLRETAAEPSTDFWAVDVPMGALPNGGQNPEVRRIPTQIPDKAREILVYAQVATGYVKGGPHRFRISVRVQGDREAAFYLYAIGLPQQSWAYNSDNVWLPMPRDRQLILRAEGEPFFGDWRGEVRIVGYR